MSRTKPHPTIRTSLVALGILLIAITPLVGPIPGPGGIIVFGAGLGLILKYTGWAKRLYVRFKRRHPNKGRWADWSLRRESARRREAIRKQAGDGASAPARAAEPAGGPPRRRAPSRPPPILPEARKPIRERRWWE